MISFLSSSEVTNVLVPCPEIFFWITANDDLVNPNSMSTLLSSTVKIFLAYIKAIFTNGPRHSPTKSPDLIIIIHTYIYHTYIYQH